MDPNLSNGQTKQPETPASPLPPGSVTPQKMPGSGFQGSPFPVGPPEK